jgi:phosphoenolpyruvate carboxykinase (ATP)
MTDTINTPTLDEKNGVFDLWSFGQKNLRHIHRNLSTPQLYEQIVKKREGLISKDGPVVVRTGDFRERPLTDKFIVDGDDKHTMPIGAGELNRMTPETFTKLLYRLVAYVQNKDVYVQYCHVGRSAAFQAPFRFVTETAWHSLYVRNMYTPIEGIVDFSEFETRFSVVHIPGFRAVPEIDGTRTEAFVLINLSQKVIFICGTHYAGEIRQAIFSVLNYLVPSEEIFLMRCAANIGPAGDVALFMGRSGTGKTTLAFDTQRDLVGDHILGWTDQGIFNFEQGAYPNLKHLSAADAPEIHAGTRRFGTILENVAVDGDTRRIDLTDTDLTDNIRAVFRLSRQGALLPKGLCAHPKHLFLLTCDALGVLPPLARLSAEMAVYAFMSGYTSQRDTQGAEPQADIQFNTCFGNSTLTLPAHVYGSLLTEKLNRYNVSCWLVNTGWVGDSSLEGSRIDISISRALVRAAISNNLEGVVFETDPVFGYEIPTQCPGIPTELLDPRKAARDQGEYELRANRLAQAFQRNFSQFEKEMPENMRALLSEVLSVDDSFDLLESMGFSI